MAIGSGYHYHILTDEESKAVCPWTQKIKLWGLELRLSGFISSTPDFTMPGPLGLHTY